ncbi:MAG TPA: DUF924 family protein [Gammaproteobacteria bacterium]|nr:DUF924 family protein [Gammaproteobacteria bacterium]
MVSHVAVLDFWFGPGSGPDLWFGAAATTDREVRHRFGGKLADAVAGRLDGWAETPEGAVALVVLLDQFSLQLHRKQRRGYEQASLALPVSQRAIARGFDRKLGCEQRGFLYMPFMHAEDLALQERSVELFTRLAEECAGRSIEGFLKSAIEHRDIVRTYGRFPGRNACYGRRSTAAENDYLAQGGHF